MNINIGKTIRLSDFIDSNDGHSLLVDTSIASCLGATPGLEDLSDVLNKINELFDGIIVNPGQAEHLAEYLGGKKRAAPLIRLDWTNVYRDKDFCLPMSNVKRIMILNGEDAFQLGASAVVASFLLGFDDDFEAKNIKALSFVARECFPISMPVIIDIHPIGEKVAHSNFADSIKLGVSFMQELGADVLIIPDCDPETYQMIGDWINIPVLLRLNEIPVKEKIDNILKAGIAGFVLSENIFTVTNLSEKVNELISTIHEQRRK